MKKFVFAAVLTVAVVGYALGEEFNVNISKVDGDKITYKKGGKKDAAPAEPVTATVSSTVKVAKGKKADDFDFQAPKYDEVEVLKDGVKSDVFTKIDAEKGVTARITIAEDGADKGKITKILLIPGFGKGGFKKKDTN